MGEQGYEEVRLGRVYGKVEEIQCPICNKIC
jgi:hypothetical protein